MTPDEKMKANGERMSKNVIPHATPPLGLVTGGLRTGNLAGAAMRGVQVMGQGEQVHVLGEKKKVIDAYNPERISTDGSSCAFGTIITIDRKKHLLGGQVTGGTGTETMDPIDVSGLGDGETGYLSISIHVPSSDGILLPGGDVTGVSYASGSDVPDNDVPTTATGSDGADGTAYYAVVSRSGKTWYPLVCGNVNASFCPGNFTVVSG